MILVTAAYIDSILWLHSQHFIFFINYKWHQYVMVFLNGRLFQSGFMFASEAGAYYSEASFRVGACPYQQTFHKAGKARQEQTCELIGPNCKLRRK